MDAMFRRGSVTLHRSLFEHDGSALRWSGARKAAPRPIDEERIALGDAVVSDAAHVAAAACFSSWQSSPNPSAWPRGRFKIGGLCETRSVACR